MRKKSCEIVFLMIASMMLVSCSRGGGSSTNEEPHVVTPTDTTPPVLIINTPTSNQVFSSGATINISGRITDDLGLYRGNIKVIHEVTGTELKYQAYEIHGLRSYDFIISYTPTATTPTDLRITVSFEDHGLNMTSRSVNVKVNP